MQLSVVTRSAVLQAISECDRLGRPEFLRTYGFDSAREYFLLHNSRAYDSKAVVGVAHGFATGDYKRSKDFTGGAGVVNRLQQLGFEVTGKMDWKTEEQILACDLLYQDRWRPVRESDRRVAELSRLLRSQWPYASSIPEYRSTNSVHRKTEDLRTSHPDYRGAATRGGKLSERIAAAFAEEPERMHVLAEQLRADGELGLSLQYEADEEREDIPDAETMSADELAAAVEGKAIRRMVRVYERNPKLRRSKIAQSRKQRGNIACEACEFDFEVSYPGVGDGYVQVHHAVPLHTTGAVQTTLDDLVLLCANCHQMIHQPAKWLTIEELRAILGSVRGRAAR
ncbi:HNH endonuclease [Nocardia nova]|uniref:HNH endonuclease n=1 Tax=Nocardia nova TaxID=37330 RepID=UPI0033CC6A7D